MAFDVSTIIPEDSIEIELVHPVTGDPTGAFVSIAGPTNAAVKAETRKILDRMRGKKSTSEQDERDGINLMAARITGWVGIEKDGEPVAFSKSAAVDLLNDHPWIRKQLLEAFEDQSLFFKK
jgi:hypothetical protein